MYRPTFILNYMTADEVKRIGKSLRNSLQADKPSQPGWYIRVYSDEGYNDIIKYTRISAKDASKIAATFGQPAARLFDTQQQKHESEAKDRRERAEQQIRDAQATLAALDAEAEHMLSSPKQP